MLCSNAIYLWTFYIYMHLVAMADRTEAPPMTLAWVPELRQMAAVDWKQLTHWQLLYGMGDKAGTASGLFSLLPVF